MRTIDWKHATFGAVAILVASIVLLWSSNVLAGLFGGPAVEYRHIIAALAVTFFVKALLWPRRKTS